MQTATVASATAAYLSLTRPRHVMTVTVMTLKEQPSPITHHSNFRKTVRSATRLSIGNPISTTRPQNSRSQVVMLKQAVMNATPADGLPG